MLLLVSPLFGISQTKDSVVIEDEEIYTIVESMPSFPDGQDEMFIYIAKNIQYPKEAKRKNISGTVYIQVTVGKEGVFRDIIIKRGVHELLDKEALRIVNSMPIWKPGKQRGEPKNVSYILPIKFKLD